MVIFIQMNLISHQICIRYNILGADENEKYFRLGQHSDA